MNKIDNIIEADELNFKAALDTFLANITAMKEANRLEQFPSLPATVYTTEVGKKNIRIVTQDVDGNHKSVFCFIRMADGAVLKAAGWKAPAKHVRGTIFTDNPSEYGVGLYGADYLR